MVIHNISSMINSHNIIICCFYADSTTNIPGGEDIATGERVATPRSSIHCGAVDSHSAYENSSVRSYETLFLIKAECDYVIDV